MQRIAPEAASGQFFRPFSQRLRQPGAPDVDDAENLVRRVIPGSA
jgi:hypothetical protein